MAGASTPGSLNEWLRKRREEEEKRIEVERQRYWAWITSRLGKLGASARSAATSAPNSIESDLAEVVDRQRAVLRWSWGLPLAAGIALFLLISLGNWGCRSSSRAGSGPAARRWSGWTRRSRSGRGSWNS